MIDTHGRRLYNPNITRRLVSGINIPLLLILATILSDLDSQQNDRSPLFESYRAKRRTLETKVYQYPFCIKIFTSKPSASV